MRTLKPMVRVAEYRTTRPEPKQRDPFYLSEPYLRWREYVIRRAGGQCQAIEDGQRCEKAAPHHRMFADHINELKDGGAALDVANGQCLCGQHHTLKTVQARARRFGLTGGRVRPSTLRK